MKFEITGTLRMVERSVTAKGKNITKLIVDLPSKSQYPQVVPIDLFGRGADAAGTLRDGEEITVECEVGGREWNGKFYASITGFRYSQPVGQSRPAPKLPSGGGTHTEAAIDANGDDKSPF